MISKAPLRCFGERVRYKYECNTRISISKFDGKKQLLVPPNGKVKSQDAENVGAGLDSPVASTDVFLKTVLVSLRSTENDKMTLYETDILLIFPQ
ncbi:hypothetical protein DP113_30970 [Brasilonema octagenarum UFV-E1]|uniref:Uncharacterized protein n=1 Tax=Brasilonema sennae CENA114 TaxID=415709 RepID=A0A856MQK7_9CYAN|nr:hypothetical protein DP114_30830 [Brasilonema sennae CENA114]QDL18086.1 hypothetical protein DP113_30970 [Brasilonema octagenarum UFV-E1]